MRLINCTHLVEAADKPLESRRQIQIDQDKISAVGDIAAADRDSEQLFVLPALVNAHDHGRAGAHQFVQRQRQAAGVPGCNIRR